MRVVSVVGARPQFIKAAPLSRALRQRHEEYLIHTGQHYDPEMSDVFFDDLAIPHPDANLGIGAIGNLEQVARMLLGLQPLIAAQHPDWVLVYGDTNSTLAGALAGRLLNIPVAHVEAGLRSYNRAMPEEHNRVLADHISEALFCPTDTAAGNLAREGITAGVFVVGDVMIDALLQNRQRARERLGDRLLQRYSLAPGEYFLATVHRAGNTDDRVRLAGIMEGLAAFPGAPVILPAHPRLRGALEQHRITPPPNVQVIAPLGYLEMLSLISTARLILTDSGGLQKEAYALSVPCLTLRDETEWVETIESGWNRLVGAEAARIRAGVEDALAAAPPQHPDFYGDGHASERIVEILGSHSAAGRGNPR